MPGLKTINNIEGGHTPILPLERAAELGFVSVGFVLTGLYAAAKAIARDFFNGGHTVYGAIDGFEGLAKGDLMEMKWDSVKVRAAALCGACWSCSRPGGLFAWRIAPCFFLSLQVVSSSA